MKRLAFLLFFALSSIFSNAQTYFPPIVGNTWDTLSPARFNYCQKRIDSLYAFLDSQGTKAFILLKDGKIVLEQYFGTHTVNTPYQWNSAGKTITSFMVGIAQQEGRLSISDTTSKYLGRGWTNCTPAQENAITVRHQLTMSSGLDDGVPDNYCTDDTCLIYKAPAGTRWAYHNAPYTLLDSVIRVATGVPLNTYINQKLKTPTGMTGAFYQVGYNNVFLSTARSMARFGLLILNKGKWNGRAVMTDTNYFNQMVNTSQQINKSYGYLWWLNGKQSFMVPQSQIVFPGPLFPHAPAETIAAMGKDGQFLNIVPSQNLVWLRMGEQPNSALVPFLLNDQIWEYINKLDCSSTGTQNIVSTAKIQMYPNPTNSILNVSSDVRIEKIEIWDVQGRCLQTDFPKELTSAILVENLQNGVYFAKVTFSNGATQILKFLKN